jgi:hypothetical protein
VGGTSTTGDAIVLETVDGGATWSIEGLGTGQVTDIGAASESEVLAGRACSDAPDTCQTGWYRRDADGAWSGFPADWPARLSFSGPYGAGLFLAHQPSDLYPPVDGPGGPTREIWLTGDGVSWTPVGSPCGLEQLQDVVRVTGSTVVALCEGQGAGGTSRKTLHRSEGAGQAWQAMPAPPDAGTGMHLDVSTDGTGWLWGPRSPMLATSDGGRTWSPLDVADGEVRIVLDADAWGAGAGVALVWDPERQATLLLRTDDGQAWTELSAFAAPARGG